jgi:copper chaperone CopZ
MCMRSSLAALLLVAPGLAGAAGATAAACEPADGSGADPFLGVALEISDLGGCRGCARSIERALGRLPGVRTAELDPDLPVVCISAAAEDLLLDEAPLRQAVKDVGYTSGAAHYRLTGSLRRRSRLALLELGPEVTVLLTDPDRVLADLGQTGEQVRMSGVPDAGPEGGWALRVSSVIVLDPAPAQ